MTSDEDQGTTTAKGRDVDESEEVTEIDDAELEQMVSVIHSVIESHIKLENETNETNEHYSRFHHASSKEVKAEDLISKEILEQLAEIFIIAESEGNKRLNLEQFTKVLSLLLNKPLSDEEFEIIYMKVDSQCIGDMSWGDYLNYILLELKMRDHMHLLVQKPFQNSAKFVDINSNLHKDSIVSIVYQAMFTSKMEARGNYFALDKEGYVTVWDTQFKLKRKHTLDFGSKYILLSAACMFPENNVMIIGTTAAALTFYDTGQGKCLEMSSIVGLPARPTCIYHWQSPHDENKSMLLLGDDHGDVVIIVFTCHILHSVFNNRKLGANHMTVHFDSLLLQELSNIHAIHIKNVHADLVQKVKYVPFLGGFVSACKNSKTAMCIGKFDIDTFKYNLTRFHVFKGVNSFDVSSHLHVIVTGGYDELLRVWNPYSLSKPSAMLFGHQSPIILVHINNQKEIVISAGENKEIRIHDLNSQICIQSFTRSTLPSDLGPRHFSAYYWNEYRMDFVIATTKIAVLESREFMWGSPDTMSQITPVVKALYNPLFQYIVSAGWDSSVYVWDVVSGRKLVQFKTYEVPRHILFPEITAMSFDQSFRRLITANSKGLMRMWNFNNGELVQEFPNVENMEINTMLVDNKSIFTGGWSQRVIVLVADVDDYKLMVYNPYHKDDVTSLAIYKGHILASGCYSGDVYLWHIETGFMTNCISPAKHTDRLLSLSEQIGISSFNPDRYNVKELEQNPKMCQQLQVIPSYLISDQKTEEEKVTKNKILKTKHSCCNTKPSESCKSLHNIASKLQADHSVSHSTNHQGEGVHGHYDKEKLSEMKPLQEEFADQILDSTCTVVLETKHLEHEDADRKVIEERMSDKPAMRKIRNSGFKRENSPSIDIMLFLQDREITPDNGTLLMARSDGSVLIWSVHLQGKQIDSFKASHLEEEPVTAMIYIEHHTLLITTDLSGYVRMWDINHFGNEKVKHCSSFCQSKWEHFPFIQYKRRLIVNGDYKKVFAKLKQDNPHLINAFRGHLEEITSVDYIKNTKGNELIITGSKDCSIRLWGLHGEYFGCYGQEVQWNLKGLVLPIWRDGNYVEFWNDDNSMLIRKHADSHVMIPIDVKKVASATTMTVFLQGRRSHWYKVKALLAFIYGMTHKNKSHPESTKEGEEDSKAPTPMPLSSVTPSTEADIEEEEDGYELDDDLATTEDQQVKSCSPQSGANPQSSHTQVELLKSTKSDNLNKAKSVQFNVLDSKESREKSPSFKIGHMTKLPPINAHKIEKVTDGAMAMEDVKNDNIGKDSKYISSKEAKSLLPDEAQSPKKKVVKEKKSKRVPPIKGGAADRLQTSTLASYESLKEECEHDKLTSYRSDILGKHYKKQRHHVGMARVKLPLGLENHCPVYNTLSCYHLNWMDGMNPMNNSDVRRIGKTFSLPPISSNKKDQPRRRLSSLKPKERSQAAAVAFLNLKEATWKLDTHHKRVKQDDRSEQQRKTDFLSQKTGALISSCKNLMDKLEEGDCGSRKMSGSSSHRSF